MKSRNCLAVWSITSYDIGGVRLSILLSLSFGTRQVPINVQPLPLPKHSLLLSNFPIRTTENMAPSRWRILEGKAAAITGGTTGIGRGVALEYLRQGCNVAINHLGLPKDEVHKDSLLEEVAALKAEKVEGEKTSKAGDLLLVAGDITKSDTGTILVGKAVEKWRRLDIFVANAGVFEPAEFLSLDHGLFDRTLHINVNGAFYTCQAAARQMVKQGHGGSIIAISSISEGGGLQVHYTPTKAAVLSMIQSMAISMGKHTLDAM